MEALSLMVEAFLRNTFIYESISINYIIKHDQTQYFTFEYLNN